MGTDLISHVGIAVGSLEKSIPLYESILGFKAGQVIEVPDQNVGVGDTVGAGADLRREHRRNPHRRTGIVGRGG